MIIMASVNELTDLEQVKRLAEHSDILALQDNQPQLVILSVERYCKLTGAAIPISTTPAPSAVPATQAHSALSATPALSVPPTHTEPEKIGQLVQRMFRYYSSNNVLPKDEIQRLCNRDYSYNTFGSWFPVLKLYNPALSLDEQRWEPNRNGIGFHHNYYCNIKPEGSYPLPFHGQTYLLCSQWFEKYHRRKFEQWMKRWE